jgi:hypothetical protein
MAKEIADNVFLAAFDVIDVCTDCQVRTSGSAILVDLVTNSVTLDAGNFGAPGEGSASNGRKMQCLVSQASDMKAISVSSAGAALRIAIGISSASSMVDYVVTELSGAVSLGGSDQINLGTFSVAFADPT